MDLTAWEALWTVFPDQWHAVLMHAKCVAASDFDAGLAALHAVPTLGRLVEAEADAEAALAALPDDEWLCHHCGKWLTAVGGLEEAIPSLTAVAGRCCTCGPVSWERFVRAALAISVRGSASLGT